MKSRIKVPRHLAVIMDGNGRWAVKRNLSRIEGHRQGATSVRVLVRACEDMGIRYLTLYTLSTENLRRPRKELDALMSLVREYLESELDALIERGIRLRVIGDVNLLPRDIRIGLEEAQQKSAACGKMTLIIAICYGAREEITRAAEKLASAGSRGRAATSRKLFEGMLYTAGIPDPDLLIRTGGEKRISNFLLWQIAYAELYFTDTLWPEFRRRHLVRALQNYAARERRFGMTGEQVKTKTATRRKKSLR